MLSNCLLNKFSHLETMTKSLLRKSNRKRPRQCIYCTQSTHTCTCSQNVTQRISDCSLQSCKCSLASVQIHGGVGRGETLGCTSASVSTVLLVSVTYIRNLYKFVIVKVLPFSYTQTVTHIDIHLETIDPDERSLLQANPWRPRQVEWLSDLPK